MKRKNILAVIALVAVFAFALVGCGSKDKEPTANTAASVPEMSVGQELTLTSSTLTAATWSSPNGATVNLTATPNGYAEGQSAAFIVRLEGEEAANVPCEWNGSAYTASADLNAADGYCYYVVLNGADGTSTEVAVNTPAEPINEDYINLKSALEAYCSLTLGESALENGKLVISSGAATVQAPRITDAGQEVGCTKATLILTLDGQEIATKELTMAPGDTAKSYECALDDVSFDLPATLGAEQRLTLRLDAELSNGQKLTAEGVTWYYQDGNLANAVG